MIFRLLRFLLLVAVGYVLYKWLWKGESLWPFKSGRKRRYRSPPDPKSIEEMKKDPVCGTYIPEKQAIKYKIDHTTHYFCSEECKQKFQELKE
jgi:YHS domain-containing protein